MAPKSSAGKEKLIDEDDVLQAVILADSFNKRFRPLTSRKPRCLLPICNASLLDWTFESLALAGVQEIFVVCRSYADLVKEAIKQSKWSKPSSGIKIVPIVTAKETFSPGDAMRDIYTHGIITSDFVLVTGDLVSNIRIDEVVKAHKERRKTNKDAIMTMVVKESGVKHRTRSRGESSVFILDSETSECLHYEPIVGYPPTSLTRIPRELLEQHPDLEIRNDLIDCSIDVCSVEVPSLFQDNFDYGDIRKDFVHGVLTSDLLMKNIHCYVAKEGYAARVKDTRSYDSISKDILSRWAFPLVPDDSHPGGHIYEYLRGNKYISKDNTVVLARTCKIGNNTLIGSSTKVLERAQITGSVIGQRCIIGAGAVIRDAYIFDDSVIGSGCVIEHSIIGAGVNIKERSRVERGCLVGDGVTIGPQAVLVPFEKLSKRREKIEKEQDEDGDDEADEDSEVEEVEENQDDTYLESLGEGTNAIVWPRPVVDEDEEIDPAESPENQRLMRIGDDASDMELSDPGSVTSDDDSESSDDDDDDFNIDALALSSTSSLPLSTTTNLTATADAHLEEEFKREVELSLERAFSEGHSVDNAAVELKTLRMASNVPLIRVREAVVGAIVERITIVEGGGIPQRKEIASVISRWGDLINQIGGVDAVETVSVLQEHCSSSDRMPLFGQILLALYQDDVVDETDIRKWHMLPSSKGVETFKAGVDADNMKKCWAVGAKMIEQFDEQDSEEEESDDDVPVAKAAPKAQQKDEEEESEEEESSEESEEEDDTKDESAPTEASKGVTEPPETPDDSEEESEADDDDDASVAQPSKDVPAVKTPAEPSSEPAKAETEETKNSDEEEESDKEEGKPQTKDDSATLKVEPEENLAESSKAPAPAEKADSESGEEESESEAGDEADVTKKLEHEEEAPAESSKGPSTAKDEKAAEEEESEEGETESESEAGDNVIATVKKDESAATSKVEPEESSKPPAAKEQKAEESSEEESEEGESESESGDSVAADDESKAKKTPDPTTAEKKGEGDSTGSEESEEDEEESDSEDERPGASAQRRGTVTQSSRPATHRRGTVTQSSISSLASDYKKAEATTPAKVKPAESSKGPAKEEKSEDESGEETGTEESESEDGVEEVKKDGAAKEPTPPASSSKAPAKDETPETTDDEEAEESESDAEATPEVKKQATPTKPTAVPPKSPVVDRTSYRDPKSAATVESSDESEEDESESGSEA